MTPFLRVWAQYESNVVSAETNVAISDIVNLTLNVVENLDIGDRVTLYAGTTPLAGEIYHVDYSTKVAMVYAPGHGALTLTRVVFAANFMFYGIPYLGEVKYLEWRDYSRNIKGSLVPQPSSVQPIEWSVPVLINGVKSSCVDRTLQDVLEMFEVLSNKKIVVEMFDEEFQQRVFDAYIVNESFSVVESKGEDIETQLTFTGLLEATS